MRGPITAGQRRRIADVADDLLDARIACQVVIEAGDVEEHELLERMPHAVRAERRTVGQQLTGQTAADESISAGHHDVHR